MKRPAVWLGLTLALGIALGVIGRDLSSAQPAGIKRTILLRTDVTVSNAEAVMAVAEVAPGMAGGRHAHHGHELGYVLEGSAVLEVDGRPTVTLNAGDTYHIEAGVVHDARNAGSVPAKALAIFIVEKGEPLAVPSP